MKKRSIPMTDKEAGQLANQMLRNYGFNIPKVTRGMRAAALLLALPFIAYPQWCHASGDAACTMTFTTLAANQVPGKITRTAATVTAVADLLVCKFTHPNNAHVLVSCALNGIVRLKNDLTPSPESDSFMSGKMADTIEIPDAVSSGRPVSIEWTIKQIRPSVFSYSIMANGKLAEGTF